MKKITIILLSLILLIAGCSSSNSYTEQDLIDYGYEKNGNGHYRLEVGESSVFVILNDTTGEPIGIAVEVYPSNYQTIQLAYMFDENGWSATYYNGKEGDQISTNINPNDAYAYINSIEPNVIVELMKLVESKNIDTTALEGGDKATIDELITDAIKISNVTVKDSTYTNDSFEEDFVNSEYFLQVNFDITNNSENSINLKDWNQEICFETPTGTGCDYLAAMAPGDTYIDEQTLNPGATISVQMTGIVPGDATNFYITFESYEDDTYIASAFVNK